eukprot:SAG31_NODE_10044_length_1192_cov_1.033852_1_plen_55_part_10
METSMYVLKCMETSSWMIVHRNRTGGTRTSVVLYVTVTVLSTCSQYQQYLNLVTY